MAKQYGTFLLILAVWTLSGVVLANRLYDLEAECQRVYKEPLKSVLARFRRTPDYLHILQDKQQHMYSLMAENWMQALTHYSGATMYLDRIRRALKLQWPNSKNGVIDDDQKKECHKRAMAQMRTRSNSMKPTRRADGSSSSSEGFDRVEELDNYEALHSVLTLDERNAAKDVGFELARQVIRTTIASFGGVNGPIPTTEHPYGGKLCDVTDATIEETQPTVSGKPAGQTNGTGGEDNNVTAGSLRTSKAKGTVDAGKTGSEREIRRSVISPASPTFATTMWSGQLTGSTTTTIASTTMANITIASTTITKER